MNKELCIKVGKWNESTLYPFGIQLSNPKAVNNSTLYQFTRPVSEPRIVHWQKTHHENVASVDATVENSFYKMPRLHDLCTEIASSEGMAILNSVELECMIYSKLSDRYKGFFWYVWFWKFNLSLSHLTMNGTIYYSCKTGISRNIITHFQLGKITCHY